MNRGRKLKQFRKFILNHSNITKEYICLPNKTYRKGSYHVTINSDELGFSCCCEGGDKYSAYKTAFYVIKQEIARNEKKI